jgi:hypothetical protein
MKTLANDSTVDATMDMAEAIYDRLIRPKLESENVGRLVAIDVDSEQFEIGDRIVPITDRLRERRPEARIGIIRIGIGPVYQLGLRGRPE